MKQGYRTKIFILWLTGFLKQGLKSLNSSGASNTQISCSETIIYMKNLHFLRFLFAELHGRHIKAALSNWVRPPLLYGFMWSMVKSDHVRTLPHFWHLLLSEEFQRIRRCSGLNDRSESFFSKRFFRSARRISSRLLRCDTSSVACNTVRRYSR